MTATFGDCTSLCRTLTEPGCANAICPMETFTVPRAVSSIWLRACRRTAPISAPLLELRAGYRASRGGEPTLTCPHTIAFTRSIVFWQTSTCVPEPITIFITGQMDAGPL